MHGLPFKTLVMATKIGFDLDQPEEGLGMTNLFLCHG
jgi:hypothetical protein